MKISLSFIKTIIIVVLLLVLCFFVFIKFKGNDVTIKSSSNLIDIKEIEELNVAKTRWNGIAEVKDESTGEIKTYIKYEADIIAKMSLKDINDKIVVNENKKEIIATLPKIELKPTILFKDEGKSFSFIPDNVSIDLKELLEVCESDAQLEADSNNKLMEIAEENAKNTIEGLLFQFLDKDNYKLVWKEAE
jgi:hypothetical protein